MTKMEHKGRSRIVRRLFAAPAVVMLGLTLVSAHYPVDAADGPLGEVQNVALSPADAENGAPSPGKSWALADAKENQSKSAPAEPPIVRIKVPTSVEVHNLVHVELEKSGGPIRELDIVIEPDVPSENMAQDPTDPNKFAFVGAPKIYTIRVLATGAEKGYCQCEARVAIRDPRPQPAPAETAAAPSKPEDLLRKWALDVPSRNREVEVLEIAKAAREAAREVRAGRVQPAKAAEEWAADAYLRLGSALKPWNQSAGTPSFFAHVNDLFADNATLSGADQASLLESLAAILEGK
ncbi:MAG TPA: hypothetical protein VGG64_08875 [Pirellulales bacterium]|jgi:hypothetical protein